MYGFYFIEHDPVLSVFIFVNRYALTSTSCCFLVIMCQAGDTTLRYLKTLVVVSWRTTLYTGKNTYALILYILKQLSVSSKSKKKYDWSLKLDTIVRHSASALLYKHTMTEVWTVIWRNMTAQKPRWSTWKLKCVPLKLMWHADANIVGLRQRLRT